MKNYCNTNQIESKLQGKRNQTLYKMLRSSHTQQKQILLEDNIFQKAQGLKNNAHLDRNRIQRFKMQKTNKGKQLSVNMRKGSPAKAEVDLFSSISASKETLKNIVNIKNLGSKKELSNLFHHYFFSSK